MPIQRILTSAPVMIILFLAPAMIGIAKAMIDFGVVSFSTALPEASNGLETIGR